MKLFKALLVLAAFAVLLAACAAPSTEPTASDEAPEAVEEAPALAPVEDEPALEPAPVQEGEVESEEGVEMIQPNAPAGAGNAASDADPAPEKMVVEPSGEVDLGSLTPEPTVQSEPREMPAPGIPGPSSPLIEQIKEDLSLRFDIPLEQIRVIEQEEVTWPNSGLGCPQPGYGYLDVLVPGQRIILAAGNNVYEYHSGGGNFVFCKDGVGQPRISPAPGVPVNPSDT